MATMDRTTTYYNTVPRTTTNSASRFLVGALLFIGGFLLGMLFAEPAREAIQGTQAVVSDEINDLQRSLPTDAYTGSDPDGVAFTINLENVPEAQRAFLRTFGINGNTLTVSNAMFACAEASLGAARIAEIRNGAVPSAVEGAQLMACYNV